MTITSQEIIERGRAAALLMDDPTVRDLFRAKEAELVELLIQDGNSDHLVMVRAYRGLARELAMMRHAGEAEMKRNERFYS